MGAGVTSMTGYGSSSASVQGWQIAVECRSVNHKALSLRFHAPDELRWLEPEVAKRLKLRIHRGRVDVRFRLHPGSEDGRVDFEAIDENRFAAVARELKRLAVDHGLYSPVSMEAMWEYRSFFERSTDDVFSEESVDVILPAFDEALDEMIAGRQNEGEGIGKEVGELLQRLASLLEEVEELIEVEEAAQKTRVESRLRQALEDFEVAELDERRLAQEVAYYVEKGDISEEFQRTRSHIERLQSIVEESQEAVGKKIDFYLQELIRETNTMGSKSQHAALTDRIIDMKSVVEKMREQAANIE